MQALVRLSLPTSLAQDSGWPFFSIHAVLFDTVPFPLLCA